MFRSAVFRSQRRGFTLIELLAVAAVVGAAIGIIVVAAVSELRPEGDDAASARVSAEVVERWELEVSSLPVYDNEARRWSFDARIDGGTAACTAVTDDRGVVAVICDGAEVPAGE